MDNTPKQQPVTREDVDVCMNGCDLMSRQLVERLLTERDEALKLNAELMRWKEAYRSTCISLGGHEEPIDAEAKRIVEEGK